MKSYLAAAAATLLSLNAMATDIRWSSDAFQHTTTVAPGKSAEVCGAIESRLPVQWRYVADGPLTFNIHRHSGDDVIYAMKSYLTREQNGTFSPTLNFDWCWMWTNESTDVVTVRVEMKR